LRARPSGLALLALVGLAAMAPVRHHPRWPARPVAALPLPPLPPPGGPGNLTAPRPDPDAGEPAPLYYAEGPTFAPAWFSDRSYSASQGFTPGSQFHAHSSGHMELAPGVEFRVPLK
jgi:hypothetical protein